MKFEIINTNNQTKRSFRIVVGLQESYTRKILRTHEEAKTAMIKCLELRRKESKLYLPGFITLTTAHYWNRVQGKTIEEPCFFFEGELSPEHHIRSSDENVIQALQEIAFFFAETFKQKRIYFWYRDIHQILSFED